MPIFSAPGPSEIFTGQEVGITKPTHVDTTTEYTSEAGMQVREEPLATTFRTPHKRGNYLCL